MPFVIRHKRTNRIFSCMLTNIYDFEYYGVKSWDSREEAEADFASFLLLHGVEPASDWEPAEVDERLLKLFNVKLNNDPEKRVFLMDGKAVAMPAADDDGK